MVYEPYVVYCGMMKSMEAEGVEPRRREPPPFQKEDAPVGITVDRAEADDLEMAKRTVFEKYRETGLTRDSDNESPISRFLGKPETTTFVAKNHGEVLGTVSVVFGDHLPMETVFAKELQKVRENGNKVAEVCQLATKGESLTLGRRIEVLEKLFKSVRDLGVHEGIDDLVIEVNPTHQAFYESDRFKFKKFGGPKPNPDVNDALAVALIRSLKGDLPKSFFKGSTTSH